MENLFEQASRLKLRYKTKRGTVDTEDLWDMPLTSTRGMSLNELAKSLNRELKDAAEEDFVETRATDETKETRLKFEIVKRVIAVKKAERDAAQTAKVRKEKREKIMRMMETKKDEALSQASLEDLEKMLGELS